jgi:hypothetical protein
VTFLDVIPLAATGQTVNILIPIIAAVLLLGGVGAIVYTQLRKRRMR